MSRWQPWMNPTKDTREQTADRQHSAANKAANAAQAPSATMRPVVDAATGTGDWPASQPLTAHNNIEKKQT